MNSDTSLDAAADRVQAASLDRPPSLAFETKMAMVSQAWNANRSRSMLRDVLRMVCGPGRLTVDEICYYRLLDGDVPPAALPRFVGKKRQARFHRACNDLRWYAAVHDKELFQTIMTGAGLPVPYVIAVSGPARPAGRQHLASADEVADFLMRWPQWPVFLKPIDGMFSLGALRISGAEGQMLSVDGHGAVPAHQVAAYMMAMSPRGYLIQECLRPAAVPPFHFGAAVPTVRLLVLLDTDGAHIESAVLKLPATNAIADNFWRAGNLLGAIDAETGALTRIVSGTGTEMQIHDRHPQTGFEDLGTEAVTVPAWDAVCGLATRGAGALPGLRTQSWDIALTDQGPVVLEVNFGGDFNLHQLANRRGVLSDRYVEHLARCGLKVSPR